MSKKITIQPGQTLFDIAVQYYGALAAISLIMSDNPDLADVTETELKGLEIIIRDPVPAIDITNKQVAEGFKENILKPATLYPLS
jgi:Phage Tail Protein X.